MKLSEAILLGSVTGPQIRHELSDGKGGTCAMGSAYQAIGAKHFDCLAYWPWLKSAATCPVCDSYMPSTTFIITNHLNDKHCWTREKIAEWVAKIEPQESPAEQMLVDEYDDSNDDEESGADIRKEKGISDFALNQHVTGGNWNS